MVNFIENVESQQYYIPPIIAPFSIRKYQVGINTSNNVFRGLENGSFFVMARDLDLSESKDTIYYVYDNFGDLVTHSINIKTGEMDAFTIDCGEWS